jgi:glutamyl-tRNA reductase
MRPNTSPVACDLLAVEEAHQVFEHLGLEDAVILGQPSCRGLVLLDLAGGGVEAIAAWRRKITPSTGMK